MAATSLGNGPDVVIVPGLAVSRYLHATQQRLVAAARVHRLALPGTSGAPRPPQLYGMVEDVQAVIGWLERHLAGRRPVLVGHSYGSQVAARVAAAVPDRVRALVLVSPTVDPAHRTLPRLAARWISRWHREPSGLNRFQVPELWHAGVRRPLAMLRAMVADRMEAELAAVEVPVTVVFGDRDPLASHGWVKQLVQGPESDMVEVPDAPHSFPYDRPEALAEVIRGIICHGNAAGEQEPFTNTA